MLGVNDMAKRKSKKNKYKKMKKILLGVLIGYAVLLLGAYFIGVFYYSKHFYPGSKINGMDCSGKTVEEAEKSMKSQIAGYILVLKERGDKVESISASQIDMRYIDDGKIAELKKEQSPFTWFLSFAHKKDYTMSATTPYNKEAVYAAIDGLACFQEENVVQPVDAHLEVGANGYEVVPEVQGTALDKEKVKEAVIDTGWLDQLCQTEEYGITVLVKNLVLPMSVASVYFDEKKGKCDWVKMMRTSRLRYCVTKAIAVFVGSIFLYMMSVFLFIAIGSMMHPEILKTANNSYFLVGEMWQKWIQDGMYWGVFFLYVVLNSLQVAAWSSMLGLCVAAFSENRYVVAAVPFFINRIFLYLGDMIDWLSIVSPYSYQPIQFWYTGTQVDLFWLAFKNLAVMFLFTCIFIEEMKWRSLHG